MSGADKHETVELGASVREPGAYWQPHVGQETLDLLASFPIPDSSKIAIRDEAVRILARCVPPTATAGTDTGIVIGYVQSGKTMSFTTVTALARDNGYQLVIVITGISVNLLGQSSDRLVRDLRLDSRTDRKWRHFQNPTPAGPDATNILNILRDWNDDDVPAEGRRTVLITVMKNVMHLNNLVALLRALPLVGRPALIIDDEADQAGLNNNVRRGDESATYKCLRRLRDVLPHHSYLQYTATPQAPLLINLIDFLSPRFGRVLTPGPEYIGGRDLFVDVPRLVKTIPDSDVPTSTNVLTEPPESLLDALRVFLLGVAAGVLLDHERGNRSMLVHPSQRRDDHRLYFSWVDAVLKRWSRTLELNDNDPDRRELLDEFRDAYADLQLTTSNLPPFDELARRLKRATRLIQVEEVNTRAGATPEIDWATTYPHILVGGQSMDRGFTVEGLTVTYMPRSLGVGNADNVQQRARFLGYKRPYIGYCRVYVNEPVRLAYERYVLHEEDIRSRLEAHFKTGRPLTEWKREFFLTSQLKPTRKSVMGFDYMRTPFGDEWWTPQTPQDSDLNANRGVVGRFLATLKMVDDSGHQDRTEFQRHKVARGVRLDNAFDELLTPYTVAGSEDSQKFTVLRILIHDYLDDHPDATCTIYQMSAGRARERSTDDEGRIKNLYQGAHPDTRGAIYPGDRQLHDAGQVTIQIHMLDVVEADETIERDVPTLAIWTPASVGQDLIYQNQPLPTPSTD